MAGTQVQGVPQGLVEEEIPQQNTQSVQGVPEGLTEEALPAPNNPALEVAKANVAKYPKQEAQEENHWVGKMVPQSLVPTMSAISESAPIKKSEEIGQKLGHKSLEKQAEKLVVKPYKLPKLSLILFRP